MNLLEDLIDIDNSKTRGLVGLNDEFFSLYLNKYLSDDKENILIVTSSLYEANMLNNTLSNYTNRNALFPMDDFLTCESVAQSPELKLTRLETINNILNKSKNIIITHLDGYLKFLPSRNNYEKSVIKLKKNAEYNREKLIEELTDIGYKRETIVSKTGEIGIRGFVIDVFPVEEANPIRVEFFGDDIESIRVFDEDTQKTIKEIDSIEIYPNTDVLNNKEYESIYDYLDDPTVIFKNINQIEASYKLLATQIMEFKESKNEEKDKQYMFSLDDIKPKKVIYYNTIDNITDKVPKNCTVNFGIKEVPTFNENIETINTYISQSLQKGNTVIVAIKDYQIKSFTKYMTNEYVLTSPNKIIDNKLNIINMGLYRGFIYKNYVLLTEFELFARKQNKSKYKLNFKYTSKIKNVNNLEVGDYVVHSIHGIGIYNGIKTLKQGDFLKDYLEILYQDKDKLYIPVEKIDLISKFTGKEGVAPKIHKLGGTEWQKTKLRIKNKVKDIAEKLIKLYAIRESKEGFSFSKDGELQLLFEDEFPYEATLDQVYATRQIKDDMESSHPMDRLLCGDVGYGKTEVAFRAIFKAVNDGKQVLYLCPTTILSNQQYENAVERFKNYPVNIAKINRFTSTKESREIIEKLKEGKIDVLFGTHRILSDDIKPKDLGLLIIDEEQRFGVTHKEKIKEFKENIDVLTLTATPIPRTLQMSLTGIRSLSLIETPPVDRYPVQTYVIEENTHIIKEAIYKELSRNGQVFILYNSVDNILNKKYEIERLVPEARVIEAHGQMNKLELEEKMQDFIDHKYDILICTTIIETGIDIPNVNTLIIYNANNFGLSQLYQIRGRVGRSDKIAYAYLMYTKGKLLTETAIKRLNVIKEFTELGSGFKIANRDLAIRGAGDILGSEQAGFIDSVGIDLYMKILNEEIARLKGEPIPEETIKDEKPLINVETHISDEYVTDNDLKIEIHKKINEIDSYEKLLSVKDELEDRFGNISDKVLIYMYEEWFEKLAKKLEIEQVKQTRTTVELYFSENMSNKVDGEKLFMDAYEISRSFRFQLKSNHLIIILDLTKQDEHYLITLTKLLDKVVLKPDNLD